MISQHTNTTREPCPRCRLPVVLATSATDGRPRYRCPRCAEKGISSMAAVYLTLCVLFLVLLVAEQDQFARRSHGPQCLRSAFRRWLRV